MYLVKYCHKYLKLAGLYYQTVELNAEVDLTYQLHANYQTQQDSTDDDLYEL